MEQAKIVRYALHEVLRRWEHENSRVKSTGSYIAKHLVDKYDAEYKELEAMLLKLDGKKGVK